ncbi:MAG: hypothetical protein AMXMBFR20_04290 [Planctomycetia bacterium]
MLAAKEANPPPQTCDTGEEKYIGLIAEGFIDAAAQADHDDAKTGGFCAAQHEAGELAFSGDQTDRMGRCRHPLLVRVPGRISR